MSNFKKKKLIIIAGPNGAGKTTFALEYLPRFAGCTRFINTDQLPLVSRLWHQSGSCWLPVGSF